MNRSAVVVAVARLLRPSLVDIQRKLRFFAESKRRSAEGLKER